MNLNNYCLGHSISDVVCVLGKIGVPLPNSVAATVASSACSLHFSHETCKQPGRGLAPGREGEGAWVLGPRAC